MKKTFILILGGIYLRLVSKIDRCIMRQIDSRLTCRFMNRFMPFMTMLGDLGTIWLVTAILLLFMKRVRLYGISVIVIVCFCAFLCDIVIKPIVRRLRPFVLNTEMQLLIRTPGGYSFPSGHTSSSIGAAYALFKMNRWVGLAGFLVAALIALSRMYLHVHYPTDVLAGALLGLLCGALIFKLIIFIDCLSALPAIQ